MNIVRNNSKLRWLYGCPLFFFAAMLWHYHQLCRTGSAQEMPPNILLHATPTSLAHGESMVHTPNRMVDQFLLGMSLYLAYCRLFHLLIWCPVTGHIFVLTIFIFPVFWIASFSSIFRELGSSSSLHWKWIESILVYSSDIKRCSLCWSTLETGHITSFYMECSTVCSPYFKCFIPWSVQLVCFRLRTQT